ncbi:MAG TPA: DinB family protein [Vicinamibacteria bacterium]|nr:DinB family protein [Vicinamibacteria bacterium]
MNDREFFQARRRAEKDVFLRVIRALPADRLDYRPHERSPSAAELLTTLVFEHAACAELAGTGRAEWKPRPMTSVEEAAAQFEKNWDDLDGKVAAMDDAGWTRTGRLALGSRTFDRVVGEFLWFILFDAIHHRGQLTAYIRPMGGKVPAVYGPSGDTRAQ